MAGVKLGCREHMQKESFNRHHCMTLIESWPTVCLAYYCQAPSSLLIPRPAFENGASQAEQSREKIKLALGPTPHTHSPE